MYRDKLSTFLKKHFTFHFSRSFSKYSKKLREKSCPTFASKSRFLIFFFRTNFHPRSRSKNRCDIINNLLEYISTIRTFVRNFFLLQFKEAIKGQVYPQPGRGGKGEGRGGGRPISFERACLWEQPHTSNICSRNKPAYNSKEYLVQPAMFFSLDRRAPPSTPQPSERESRRKSR